MPSTTSNTGYVDGSTQTIIQGLAKSPITVPPELSPPLPQDQHQDQHTEDKGEDKAEDMAATDPSLAEHDEHLSPDQNLPRKKRPPFNARISLPTLDLDAEGPPSPPPTYAAMSPLPAANRLHAGHTPIVPRSRSPLQQPDRPQEQEPQPQRDESGQATPDHDPSLSGALTLPSNPLDGSDDRITVKALDAELEKIAREQQSDPSSSTGLVENNVGVGDIGGDNGHENGRGSPEVEDIDGVLLKKNTKMNMGAPLGQA